MDYQLMSTKTSTGIEDINKKAIYKLAKIDVTADNASESMSTVIGDAIAELTKELGRPPTYSDIRMRFG